VSNRLLLNEHFPPVLARRLSKQSHDVVAVLDDPLLTGLPDHLIYAAALAAGRRIVTENVADFRALQTMALDSGRPAAHLLLVAARRFGRTPAGLGALVASLLAWLARPRAGQRPLEDWLPRIED